MVEHQPGAAQVECLGAGLLEHLAAERGDRILARVGAAAGEHEPARAVAERVAEDDEATVARAAQHPARGEAGAEPVGSVERRHVAPRLRVERGLSERAGLHRQGVRQRGPRGAGNGVLLVER